MKSRLPAIAFGVIVLFAIGLAASGFDPREFARKHGGTMRLSIATGNTGGVYYPYGGGLARVISRSVPNVDATAEVTAAWLRATANATERVIATAAGLLLFYAGAMSDVAGLILFAIAIALHLGRTKRQVATALDV